MDMKMYELVKKAVQDGKSMEDITKEINALVQTAQKELEPKTPIADKWGKTRDKYVIAASHDGTISKVGLIEALMTYYVQNGFMPDGIFKDTDEYFDRVGRDLDFRLASMKAADKITHKFNLFADDEITEEQMSSTILGAVRDLFNTCINI